MYAHEFNRSLVSFSCLTSLDLRHEKTSFLHMRFTKTQISCAVTAQLISLFVFAIQIVQFFFFLNLKLPASSPLLWMYRQIFVRPGRKHQNCCCCFFSCLTSLMSRWMYLNKDKNRQEVQPFIISPGV